MTADPAELDRLLRACRLLGDAALADLLQKSPELPPLLARLERLLGQCIAEGLRWVEVPPDADSRAVRRAWLATLIRLDQLARLDHARVAHLARAGYQACEPCPCGECGCWLRPVFVIDYRPSRN
jgi:hypothetical protein